MGNQVRVTRIGVASGDDWALLRPGTTISSNEIHFRSLDDGNDPHGVQALGLLPAAGALVGAVIAAVELFKFLFLAPTPDLDLNSASISKFLEGKPLVATRNQAEIDAFHHEHWLGVLHGGSLLLVCAVATGLLFASGGAMKRRAHRLPLMTLRIPKSDYASEAILRSALDRRALGTVMHSTCRSVEYLIESERLAEEVGHGELVDKAHELVWDALDACRSGSLGWELALKTAESATREQLESFRKLKSDFDTGPRQRLISEFESRAGELQASMEAAERASDDIHGEQPR